ncbi:MAG TPA: dimethylmenaquinone methyltransferase [Candidatus Dormibacteraeota bacterium]|jgi:4-hydroxy-4-methyl-2-oxoglutarate aldolase
MTIGSDFARYGVATIYQALGFTGLIDVPLKQIVPGTRAAGVARTVRCGQDDNLMVHAVMPVVEPGEVLVITMPRPAPVALVGELLATQAAHYGAVAILIDAAVRDTSEIVQLGLPVWARFIRATQATKDVIGAINEPVVVGGTAIAAGDIVVLDADGAVAVPAAQVQKILEAAESIRKVEEARRTQYRDGALSLDLMGLRSKLEPRTER